jgi:MFS family permease
MSLPKGTPHALTRLAPLYVVVFMGFVGYSLMITVFTPMLLRADRALLPPDSSLSVRTMVLGVLLCLYPLGQFIGSPILGSLSDRFGRRPILVVSLVATSGCYALIALSITTNNLPLLAFASLIAGFAEANIVTAQSAIADVVPPDHRNRYFGYIYMAVSLAYVIGPLGGARTSHPDHACDPRLVRGNQATAICRGSPQGEHHEPVVGAH